MLESIITAENEITDTSVAILSKTVGLATLAMGYALKGQFTEAKTYIEKAHIEGKYDPRGTFNELYLSINDLETDTETKARLYEKLGQVEANTKGGGDPIIQIVSFMAFVWLIPHVSKCPVLNKVG